MTWNNARAHCMQIGGDLASLHSQEDNDKVKALVQGANVYIGMNDIETEGDWKWSDGSMVQWTNWDNREPDGSTNSNCAIMSHSNNMWFSDGTPPDGCSTPRPFICSGIFVISATCYIGESPWLYIPLKGKRFS